MPQMTMYFMFDCAIFLCCLQHAMFQALRAHPVSMGLPGSLRAPFKVNNAE